MGNTCVGTLTTKTSSSNDCFTFTTTNNKNETIATSTKPVVIVQNKPPETPTMSRRDPNLPILETDTGLLTDHFSLGRKLGFGQFGTTFACAAKNKNKNKNKTEYACKSIPKTGIQSEEAAEEVRREIRVMRHLASPDMPGGPTKTLVGLEGAYEDEEAVHIVMELCSGGELFERITERGRYEEREAAGIARAMVCAVRDCHELGVMHRDLKPENFLFVHDGDDSPLKLIDFGLSVFFKPGDVLTEMVGSPFYVAPEILLAKYGQEADLWSVGVIIYVLLCGVPPFFGDSLDEIYEEILHGDIDFSSDPWPKISDNAKDLVKKILVRDPKKRLTANEILSHPWVQIEKLAPNKPLDPAVSNRLKQFSAMNKLEKLALRVIAESLSDEEIAGLKEIFCAMDEDNSGQITLEELESGLKKIGANLDESEINQLLISADIDNSGTIDCGEFIAATLHLTAVENKDHFAAAFSYFDRNGNGYISENEIQQACEDFGIKDNRVLDEMIQKINQNNDGRINYSEFVAMMQKGNNADLGKRNPKKKTSFSVGFREALSVC